MGDWIDSYLVFFKSHNGSGSIKVALTPIRVTCQNTLNLALRKASRIWSTKHTGQKNLFAETLDGNSLIDKEHHMILKTA